MNSQKKIHIAKIEEAVSPYQINWIKLNKHFHRLRLQLLKDFISYAIKCKVITQNENHLSSTKKIGMRILAYSKALRSILERIKKYYINFILPKNDENEFIEIQNDINNIHQSIIDKLRQPTAMGKIKKNVDKFRKNYLQEKIDPQLEKEINKRLAQLIADIKYINQKQMVMINQLFKTEQEEKHLLDTYYSMLVTNKMAYSNYYQIDINRMVSELNAKLKIIVQKEIEATLEEKKYQIDAFTQQTKTHINQQKELAITEIQQCITSIKNRISTYQEKHSSYIDQMQSEKNELINLQTDFSNIQHEIMQLEKTRSQQLQQIKDLQFQNQISPRIDIIQIMSETITKTKQQLDQKYESIMLFFSRNIEEVASYHATLFRNWNYKNQLMIYVSCIEGVSERTKEINAELCNYYQIQIDMIAKHYCARSSMDLSELHKLKEQVKQHKHQTLEELGKPLIEQVQQDVENNIQHLLQAANDEISETKAQAQASIEHIPLITQNEMELLNPQNMLAEHKKSDCNQENNMNDNTAQISPNKKMLVDALETEWKRIEKEEHSPFRLFMSREKTKLKKDAIHDSINKVNDPSNRDDFATCIHTILCNKNITRARHKLDPWSLFGSTTEKHLKRCMLAGVHFQHV